MDRGKAKQNKQSQQWKPYQQAKQDNKKPQQQPQLWQDRQLRDYRKANGLCYSCGEKFVPGHMQVCTKRTKPQVNALVVNDLDRELPDEVLNELPTEDALQEDFGQLSLNAISGSDTLKCIKLKARVRDKTMLILIDSGSTHSFVSSNFVQLAHIPTVSIPAKKVQVATGEWIGTNRMASNLHWYCQGHTLTTNMVVLDMHTYDAILGYDWLTAHNPMNCDWEQKTLEFSENGKLIKLQGLQQLPPQVNDMTATKVYKAAQSNDVWAYML